jgi:F0F1-type ATP synthase assembly protein I
MLKNEPKPNNRKGDYTKWFGFGIEFGGVIAVFCYIGYRLDQSWNTKPWLMLAGFFVGFTGMLYLVLKEVWNIWRK